MALYGVESFRLFPLQFPTTISPCNLNTLEAGAGEVVAEEVDRLLQQQTKPFSKEDVLLKAQF